MNILQCLLCNQYAEITKKGKDGKSAQTNTLLLATVITTMYLLIFMFILDLLSGGTIVDGLSSKAIDGKTLGRLFAAAAALVIFLILKLTIGKNAWYDKTIGQFNGLSETEQIRISKRGVHFFIYSFVPIMIFLMIILI